MHTGGAECTGVEWGKFTLSIGLEKKQECGCSFSKTMQSLQHHKLAYMRRKYKWHQSVPLLQKTLTSPQISSAQLLWKLLHITTAVISSESCWGWGHRSSESPCQQDWSCGMFISSLWEKPLFTLFKWHAPSTHSWVSPCHCRQQIKLWRGLWPSPQTRLQTEKKYTPARDPRLPWAWSTSRWWQPSPKNCSTRVAVYNYWWDTLLKKSDQSSCARATTTADPERDLF